MFPQEMPRPSLKPRGPAAAPFSLRTVQHMVAAFMLGLVAFSLVAVLNPTTTPPPPPPGALPPPDANRSGPETWVIMGGFAAALLLAAVITAAVVPRIVRTRARAIWSARATDEEGLNEVMMEYGQSVMLRSAVFEGAGLLGGVVVLLDGIAVFLAIPALALAGLACLFPTASRVADFAHKIVTQ